VNYNYRMKNLSTLLHSIEAGGGGKKEKEGETPSFGGRRVFRELGEESIDFFQREKGVTRPRMRVLQQLRKKGGRGTFLQLFLKTAVSFFWPAKRGATGEKERDVHYSCLGRIATEEEETMGDTCSFFGGRRRR